MEGSAKRRVETRAEGVSVVGSATSDFLTLIQRAAGAIRKLGPAILFTLGLFEKKKNTGYALARCYRWRADECHLWARNLSANQERDQQRSSEQTSGDHTEKPDVTIMSHFELP
jgi:hypothetical protein